MSVAKTNTEMEPTLRFPEYSEYWSSDSLKSAGFQVSDGNYGELYPTSDQFVADGIPFIRANNIKQGSVVWDDMRFIEKSLHEILTSGHLEPDDILVTTRGEIGTTALVGAEFSGANINAQICLLRKSRKCLQTFLFPALTTQAARKQFKELTTGSALKQLPRKNLMRLKIVFPALDEQRKIADFLGAMDARIALLRQRRDAFQDYKKGMMQRLFSQELRFTRDDGTAFPDWGEKQLGEVFDWIGTNSLSRAMLTEEGGMIQNIHYGDIHGKFSARFFQSKESAPYLIPEAQINLANASAFCREGDVIIADASEDYADIGKATEIIEVEPDSLLAGLHTYIARPKNGQLALGFSGYLFQTWTLRKQIMRVAQGISVLGISKTNLSKLDLKIPHQEEQRKIADFLSAIDSKIDTTVAQLDATTGFKKGLLQKMFV